MADTIQTEEPPYLISLQTRHGRLEERLAEEYLRPRPDAELVSRIKIEKLHLKEAMERFKLR